MKDLVKHYSKLLSKEEEVKKLVVKDYYDIGKKLLMPYISVVKKNKVKEYVINTVKNYVKLNIQIINGKKIFENVKKTSSSKQLELNAKRIQKDAKNIKTKIDSLDDDSKEKFDQKFAEYVGPEAYNLVTSDLPKSRILENISIRVFEQTINTASVGYRLTRLINNRIVPLGQVDEDYRDYEDNDDLSGYSDVVISDYNKGIIPTFRETYKTDIETHNGYDILNIVLNDTHLDVSKFKALLNDYSFNIGRPMAKFMYQRILTFLNQTTSYDRIDSFTSENIVDNAKQLYLTLVSLQSAGRDNLVQLPNGAVTPLEYNLKIEDTILIMTKEFSTKYKYDLTANTYQLNEIVLPVMQGNIIVDDFTKFSGYISTTLLDELDVIIMDKNVYKMITKYSGTKVSETPKLKSVINVYTQLTDYRLKNAVLVGIKKFVPLPTV